MKINLGSGYYALSGWVNYDNSILAKIDRFIPIKWFAYLGILDDWYKEVDFNKITVHNIRKGLPQKNNTVDQVYTSHFLEHLYRWEALNVLKECFRVMKRGAPIRVCVPDIELINKFIGADHKMEWYYPKIMNLKKPSMFDRIKNYFLRHHKWMYDKESMTDLLHEAGFVDVKPTKYRESFIEEAKLLDTYPDHTLYIDAMKP